MIVVILDSVLLTKGETFFMHISILLSSVFFWFFFCLISNSKKILGIIFHILVIHIILYFYVEIYNFMMLIAKSLFYVELFLELKSL